MRFNRVQSQTKQGTMKHLTGLKKRRRLSSKRECDRGDLFSITPLLHHSTIPSLVFLFLAWFSTVKADAPFDYPPVPDEKLFTALKSTSPFLRTLNISETYSLRAVAIYEDLAFARVYNKFTKQTITIEIGGEPQAGLNLIKIIEPGDSSNLTGVAAQISFAGEIAELKYAPEQITPSLRSPSSTSGRSSGDRQKDGGKDGDRKRGGSPEDRAKYEALDDKKKEKLREYIKSTVSKYPDMPGEERGNLIRGALQKLSEGRDLEIPK